MKGFYYAITHETHFVSLKYPSYMRAAAQAIRIGTFPLKIHPKLTDM
jgi:hypothetical protein